MREALFFSYCFLWLPQFCFFFPGCFLWLFFLYVFSLRLSVVFFGFLSFVLHVFFSLCVDDVFYDNFALLISKSSFRLKPSEQLVLSTLYR
jgi:hypothetical protein